MWPTDIGMSLPLPVVVITLYREKQCFREDTQVHSAYYWASLVRQWYTWTQKQCNSAYVVSVQSSLCFLAQVVYVGLYRILRALKPSSLQFTTSFLNFFEDVASWSIISHASRIHSHFQVTIFYSSENCFCVLSVCTF